MVPRVFKTNVGDIYTTNMVNETSLIEGQKLYVGEKGILSGTQDSNSGSMVWQVAKVYTLPDHQKAVKLVRIA